MKTLSYFQPLLRDIKDTDIVCHQGLNPAVVVRVEFVYFHRFEPAFPDPGRRFIRAYYHSVFDWMVCIKLTKAIDLRFGADNLPF